MNKTNWAYIAGFIDGEGCISIVGSSAKIEVTNNNKDVIDWFVAKLGGSVGEYDPTSPRAKHTYKWYISSRPAVTHVLQGVLPYLIVKQLQARLVLQFFEAVPLRSGNAEVRAAYIATMKRLNKKGREQ